MSSPYSILKNRPLDQWKVIELKEELKRRKLPIKGLKEDLVKRLDEAVRTELENAKTDTSLNEIDQCVLPPEQTSSVISELVTDRSVLVSVGMQDGNPEIEMDGGEGLSAASKIVDITGEEGRISELEEQKTDKSTIVDAATVTHKTIEIVSSLSGSNVNQDVVTDVDPAGGRSHDRVEPYPENVAHELLQVSGVDHPDLESQIISDSVSAAESVPIIEKNEVQVDVIIENVNLELNIDQEMVHPPPSSFVQDAVDTHPMEVEEPRDAEQSIEVSHASNDGKLNSLKNIDSDDLGPEKLSFDRSSGDDSLEEDVLDSKQMDYNSDSIPSVDRAEKVELLPVEADAINDFDGKPVSSGVAKDEEAHVSMKRKLNDKETVVNNDSSKKPRRWSVDEGLKGSADVPTFKTPNKSFNDSEVSLGRLGRPDSDIDESHKERFVPPSSRSPSNCLRIDRFLRPFTLKAVQELLGKTGAVTDFWMDHIKTHCYVSYSSVEEAVETRNALYNLQWPPNGGRALVAEFVEPDEVKARVDAPPAPSTTFSGLSTAQTTMQTAPSPRQQIQRKLLPPPSLLPPPPLPPLASVPPVRERSRPTWESQPREQQLGTREQLILPPPPPLVEKAEPPIVTLDDFFRKTIASPRIYYLPLSDEQVAAKLKTSGTNL